ncbi:MAG: hydroxymethylbilane synthase [Candidatus Eremiobacteraeota bacterium]|nr:hydroxymethylbilane synthase [Candidatus Eremiobacteraeota bacterium]
MGNDASDAVRYALALDVRGRVAVVVGGGRVAERKVRGLLEAGADVTVVAPAIAAPLSALAARGELRTFERAFETADVAGALLVVAATGDATVNAAVVSAARAAGALCNDASDGEHSDFITPLVHRSGPISIAVDTGGTSPSFARRIRDELRAQFDGRYATAARTLGRARNYVLATVAPEARSALMDALARRDLAELAALDPIRLEDEIDRMAGEAAPAPPAKLDGPLVCATRKSALAMHQARLAMARLAVAGIVSSILPLTTTGDRDQERPIEALGSDNVFVTELENALREGRADYAVHSCKDLPSSLPADMRLAAIGPREDARDVFCSERFASFEALPSGAVVGTSSPRRRAQLAALRPDLAYVPLRGNVDTRLRKLRDGECDAIVLAAAGLARLGLRATHMAPFEPSALTPAVGQGALAIEVRAPDEELAARVHDAFSDPDAELAIVAERAFLRAVRGGCRAPVGAYAIFAGRDLRLQAVIASLDGSEVLRGESAARVENDVAAESLGTELAGRLLAEGGDRLLARALPAGPLAGVLFLLPRTQERPSRIAPALRSAGGEVVEAADDDEAARGLERRRPDVLLFPSSGSVRALPGYLAELRASEVRPLVAAMGPASAAAAASAGFPADVVAPDAEIAAFVQSVTRAALKGRE